MVYQSIYESLDVFSHRLKCTSEALVLSKDRKYKKNKRTLYIVFTLTFQASQYLALYAYKIQQHKFTYM